MKLTNQRPKTPTPPSDDAMANGIQLSALGPKVGTLWVAKPLPGDADVPDDPLKVVAVPVCLKTARVFVVVDAVDMEPPPEMANRPTMLIPLDLFVTRYRQIG